MTEVSGS